MSCRLIVRSFPCYLLLCRQCYVSPLSEGKRPTLYLGILLTSLSPSLASDMADSYMSFQRSLHSIRIRTAPLYTARWPIHLWSWWVLPPRPVIFQ